VAASFLDHWPLHYFRFSAKQQTIRKMSSSGDEGGFTTNAKDQAEVAKLKQRLLDQNGQTPNTVTETSTQQRVPSVQVAEGTHKYVLIRAIAQGNSLATDEQQYFVASKRGAAYHRDAAEPMIEQLEAAGYAKIDVTGGGRIRLNSAAKTMVIYGFSYGFGLADHSISRRVVLNDPRYQDFDVTTSDEGY
jgi:phosphohistidine phosphatase